MDDRLTFALVSNNVDDKLEQIAVYRTRICDRCPYSHRCCEQLVSISQIEANVIARHVSTLNANAKQFIVQGLEYRYELLKQSYHTALSTKQDITQAYWQHKTKCVFYIDNKCSIYQLRPIPCREAYADQTVDCETESLLIDTGGQDILMDLSIAKPHPFAELNTALLQRLTRRKLKDYFTEAVIANMKQT